MCLLYSAKTNRNDKKESAFAHKSDDWVDPVDSAFGVAVYHALFQS